MVLDLDDFPYKNIKISEKKGFLSTKRKIYLVLFNDTQIIKILLFEEYENKFIKFVRNKNNFIDGIRLFDFITFSMACNKIKITKKIIKEICKRNLDKENYKFILEDGSKIEIKYRE